MKRTKRTLALLLGMSCGASLGWAAEAPNETEKELVTRGQYLVTFGGCSDCHTPKLLGEGGPRPDPARFLAGFPEGKTLPEIPKDVVGPVRWGALVSDDLTAWVGPWGTSFSANLTPDVETGLGSWTEAMFIQAMRTGRQKGTGRAILPPMPWYGLAPLTDSDLKAIFTYLKSLPPVKNRVPEPVPPKTGP